MNSESEPHAGTRADFSAPAPTVEDASTALSLDPDRAEFLAAGTAVTGARSIANTNPDFNFATALLPLGGIVATLAFVVFSGTSTPTIELTGDALSVRQAGNSHTVPLKEIDSVALRWNLDGVGVKRIGMQSGSAYAGTFEMKPFGRTHLFVNTNRRPYVTVYARSGVTIVSAPDSASVVQFLAILCGSAMNPPASPATASCVASGDRPR